MHGRGHGMARNSAKRRAQSCGRATSSPAPLSPGRHSQEAITAIANRPSPSVDPIASRPSPHAPSCPQLHRTGVATLARRVAQSCAVRLGAAGALEGSRAARIDVLGEAPDGCARAGDEALLWLDAVLWIARAAVIGFLPDQVRSSATGAAIVGVVPWAVSATTIVAGPVVGATFEGVGAARLTNAAAALPPDINVAPACGIGGAAAGGADAVGVRCV